MSLNDVTTRHQCFTCVHLLGSHLPSHGRLLPYRSPPRLIHRSSIRWFGTPSCKTIPEDHTNLHHQHSTALKTRLPLPQATSKTFVVTRDAHHFIHWLHGGRTDLNNLVLLCRKHHRILHHSEWDVSINPRTGLPEFRPPKWIDRERRPLRNTLRH